MQAKTSDRDYGWPHQLERRRVDRVVKAGNAICVRCHKPIDPKARWDLDHGDVKIPGQYAGPAHSSCNQSAGAKSRSQNVKRLRWSRAW